MSEQQLLDCTYIGKKSCEYGGWTSDGWRTIYNNLQNFYPTGKSYEYFGAVRFCKRKRGDNSLLASKVDYPSIIQVDYDENQPYGAPYDEKLADAVAIGPVAAAMRMGNTFKVYKSGTYTEENCQGAPNHAVVIVGYSPQNFRIKNSFGVSWGDEGYAWFDRRIQNQCMIAKFAEYPNMLETNAKDEDEPYDPCESVKCENGGNCVASMDGNYATCLCTRGYRGRRCEELQCENTIKRCPKTSKNWRCKHQRYIVNCPVNCDTC